MTRPPARFGYQAKLVLTLLAVSMTTSNNAWGQEAKSTGKEPGQEIIQQERQETTSPNVIWKPGQTLSSNTDVQDLCPTDNIDLARRQVAAYPDSPEASFILAVALTRTSHVEEALKEVRRARKLAETKGGAAFFDKMIASYEQMLVNYPDENRVRYGLAWAYYMKAYLLAKYSRNNVAWKALQAQAAADPSLSQAKSSPAKASLNLAPSNLGVMGILEKADPVDIPQIKKYYELSLQKLDELLARKADDVWAIVYRAHLRAEYTGNLEEAMKTWQDCKDKYPHNPAPYFFLGEGYLRQGNLKDSISNVSKAIALRALGN